MALIFYVYIYLLYLLEFIVFITFIYYAIIALHRIFHITLQSCLCWGSSAIISPLVPRWLLTFGPVETPQSAKPGPFRPALGLPLPLLPLSPRSAFPGHAVPHWHWQSKVHLVLPDHCNAAACLSLGGCNAVHDHPLPPPPQFQTPPRAKPQLLRLGRRGRDCKMDVCQDQTQTKPMTQNQPSPRDSCHRYHATEGTPPVCSTKHRTSNVMWYPPGKKTLTKTNPIFFAKFVTRSLKNIQKFFNWKLPF